MLLLPRLETKMKTENQKGSNWLAASFLKVYSIWALLFHNGSPESHVGMRLKWWIIGDKKGYYIPYVNEIRHRLTAVQSNMSQAESVSHYNAVDHCNKANRGDFHPNRKGSMGG